MPSPTKVLQVKNSDSHVVNDDESPARDQTQSRLRISELRYRRLFEAARDGILILDPVTLKITDVNPFMTVSVGSATEALPQMEQQRFDLLISDIGMPEMNGYDLISRIRQLGEEHGGRTPAMASTAFAGFDDRQRALAAGYEMHIPKLFVAAELISAAIFLTERHSGL